MSLDYRSKDEIKQTGWWTLASIVIWCIAVTLCGVVMVGTQSPAMRLVAMALIVAVAATLHLAFRPPPAAPKPIVAARPRGANDSVDGLHRRLVG